MNRDIFLAILSMDSYNRGYGQGIKSEFLPAGSKGAGFYGITYLIEAGSVAGVTVDTKVVMYRGSDYIPTPIMPVLEDLFAGSLGANDATNGFGVALGSPYGPQARLAMEFYNAATGRAPDVMIDEDGAVVISGHALGGIDFRPEMLGANSCVVAANDNDTDAWSIRPFRFAMEAA